MAPPPAAGNFLAKKFEVYALAGGQEREIAKVLCSARARPGGQQAPRTARAPPHMEFFLGRVNLFWEP